MSAALAQPVRSAPRRARGRSIALTLVMVFAVSIPPLLMYVGLATSMALGVMAVCLGSLAAALWKRPQTRLWPSRRGTAFAWLFAFIAAHGLVALFIGRLDLARFAASLVLLLVFLMGASSLSRQLFVLKDASFHKAACTLLLVMTASSLLALIGIAPYLGVEFAKPVFPFTEPSHFALSTLPVYLYFCVVSRGLVRQFALLAGLMAALVLQNLTMLSAALLTILICARPMTLALLSLPIVLAIPLLDLQYFAVRFNFSPESDNLSALVFVQGWQLIDESLRRSGGWGLGFQQLGVYGTEVEFAAVINALIGEDSNLSDGGFNFSKIVSEFGLFGLLATMVHLVFAARFAMRLRQLTRHPVTVPRSTVFAYAVVVGFTVDLFIRGNGYFTASSLIYATAWMHLSSGRHGQLAPLVAPAPRRRPRRVKRATLGVANER